VHDRGCGRRRRGHTATGVDIDADALRALRARGFDVRFGDAEDAHLLELLPLAGARWIVSTIPTPALNVALLKALRAHGYAGPIAVAVHDESDGKAAQAAGATHLLFPYRDAADYAAGLVADELMPAAA
jgi:Trk K+ transport system NAD-binding subunit